MSNYDLIVIGGGSGGVATANRASSYGAKVVLIEKGRMGGTCVNVGCVPKKIMWSAASLHEAVTEAKNYGFDTQLNGLDWAKLKDNRDTYIQRLNAGYERGLDGNKVEVIKGEAVFESENTVVVGKEKLQSSRILIATGGYPVIPEISGAHFGITSDGFFELANQPKKVAVVGAGYSAVEFAGLLNALGSEVSLFLRRSEFLRQFDHSIRANLMKEMEKDGVKIIKKTAVKELINQNDSLSIRSSSEDVYTDFEQVIWAVGRMPNTHTLNIESTGVETTASRQIASGCLHRRHGGGIWLG